MPKKKQITNAWGMLAGVSAVIVIVGLIWVILTYYSYGNNSAAGTQASATAPQTTGTIASPDTSATAGQQATNDAVATIVAMKATDATARAIELTASPFPTPVPGPTGIRVDEYQKLEWAKQGLVVENGFGGFVNGNPVNIWAGAHVSDPNQGVVQVLWVLPYRTFQVRVSTPGQHGSVHITGEAHNRLTLVSADGTTFYFDIPGLTFVSSPTEVVPSITPPPTYTPVMPSTAAAPTGYPLASATAVP
jgi:hypothetical protein